jgi:hypothetical protein
MIKSLKSWLRIDQKKAATETEYENFVDFSFLNNQCLETFQIDGAVAERLRIALGENEKGFFSFDTLKQRRCFVNLEYVASVNFYQDEKQSIAMPIDGIYIRLVGQKNPIDIVGDVERFCGQLKESAPMFLEAGNQYINKQMLLMAAYDIA